MLTVYEAAYLINIYILDIWWIVVKYFVNAYMRIPNVTYCVLQLTHEIRN